MTDEKMSDLLSMAKGYDDLGVAKIDHAREGRTGLPEVIFCEGKTPSHLQKIFSAHDPSKAMLIGSRASLEHFKAVQAICPNVIYHSDARIITCGEQKTCHPALVASKIGVVTAGTSDIPVAEEAATVLGLWGANVDRIFDVGVAGLHRLLDQQDRMNEQDILIVVAGMEGALPSVVAGLVEPPVVAVPTSVGYGANLQGVTAMLTMLSSCAPGISVVNIDNGFGAACVARKMVQAAYKMHKRSS